MKRKTTGKRVVPERYASKGQGDSGFCVTSNTFVTERKRSRVEIRMMQKTVVIGSVYPTLTRDGVSCGRCDVRTKDTRNFSLNYVKNICRRSRQYHKILPIVVKQGLVAPGLHQLSKLRFAAKYLRSHGIYIHSTTIANQK